MLTSFWAFIFVLGVLIFVHELGHFLMARRIGVRVLTFSLGFGPKILKFKRGDTEYAISAIPLGGYVKMAGETADDVRTGRDDEFLSKTKWQRFQVLIMGPVMNILLAIVVMWVVLFQGADVPAWEQQAVVVGSVEAESPAARGGLQPGDRIVRVAEKPVPTWEDFFMTVTPRADRQIPLVFERDGQTQTIQITPEPQGRFEIGEIGVLPPMIPQIQAVNPGEPAERAGLKPADLILRVNGEPLGPDRRLLDVISASAGRPITMRIRREGEEREVSVAATDRNGTWMIGVQVSEFERRTVEPGFFEALGMSVQRNWEWSSLIFETLYGLFTRDTSPKQLMGPVAIAQLSGGAAQAGWISLFTLMAMISLNLGILNLLPIPVLDGGHITIMAMEGIARRDFSMRAKEKMLLAGFVVLMLLMVTVIYNDLMRIEWIENLMPWR